MAATPLSVCTRAVTTNPVRRFGCLEEHHTNSVHYYYLWDVQDKLSQLRTGQHVPELRKDILRADNHKQFKTSKPTNKPIQETKTNGSLLLLASHQKLDP